MLKAKLAAKGVRDPAALAAAIGRRKYGQKQMTAMSVAGRHRKMMKALRGKH